MRASVVARGPGGERTIAADDLFTGFLETAVGPDELLTEIRVPKTAGAGWSFQKLARRSQDWAIVGVALQPGDQPGIGLVNMAPQPTRALDAAAALSAGASPAEVGNG